MPEQNSNKTLAFVSGGAWTMYNFRLDLLKSLSADGYHIVIIAVTDKYTRLLVDMGFQFEPLDMDARSLNPLHDLRLFGQLKSIYKKIRPDFIFHYQLKPVIYGTMAAALLRIPSVAVVTGLGYSFQTPGLLKNLATALYRVSLRHAEETWCLNQHDANYFTSKKILPESRLRVLPGEGVNTDYFKRSSENRSKGSFTFLMMSRLLKTKGVNEYAAAAQMVKVRHPGIRCVLIGNVEGHPDAIDATEIDSWRREGTLDFPGFQDDVRETLSEADCFVFPSYYNEGVPRSLMEACSMELPIITTANTGCGELILDHVNGLICRPQDADDLAARMEEMLALEQPHLFEMGRQGRSIVMADYSVDLIINIYSRFLQRYFVPQPGHMAAARLNINASK